MSTQLDLKQIERRAFRSTYQDGLWDLYFGLFVVCMSIFVYRPVTGYSPLNIILAMSAMAIAYLHPFLGGEEVHHPAAHGAGSVRGTAQEAQTYVDHRSERGGLDPGRFGVAPVAGLGESRGGC